MVLTCGALIKLEGLMMRNVIRDRSSGYVLGRTYLGLAPVSVKSAAFFRRLDHWSSLLLFHAKEKQH